MYSIGPGPEECLHHSKLLTLGGQRKASVAGFKLDCCYQAITLIDLVAGILSAMAIFHYLHPCHAASAFRQSHITSPNHRDSREN